MRENDQIIDALKLIKPLLIILMSLNFVVGKGKRLMEWDQIYISSMSTFFKTPEGPSQYPNLIIFL